ncbi:pur operon repressor [Staphylococcus pseudintermedius]|nr:pur operon repressor [Staphylococcus pseudintermedius]ELI4033446.1 pur operon repressor [Staphylococcus pseudintermedius]WMZ73670.1 pur operon repressor [Staphylococcus pseudintermedius]
MRYKRSERIVYMTQYLINNPNKLVPLTYFVTKFEQAKSSISEDVQIIKETLVKEGLGTVETISGASGGVKYRPQMQKDEAQAVIEEVIALLQEKERLLPGGYLFLSDLMGNPALLKRVGRLIATIYMQEELDAIVTIATKGISLANAVASVLNLPVVVIRKDNKVTEGSTVSINYVSGSTRKIETMVLSKRTLKEHSNVLVVDDFMRAGGSINGVMNLMNEFKAHVKGVSVLVESKEVKQRLIEDYTSLVRLSDVDEYNQEFKVESGNSLSKFLKGKRSVQLFENH